MRLALAPDAREHLPGTSRSLKQLFGRDRECVGHHQPLLFLERCLPSRFPFQIKIARRQIASAETLISTSPQTIRSADVSANQELFPTPSLRTQSHPQGIARCRSETSTNKKPLCALRVSPAHLPHLPSMARSRRDQPAQGKADAS